MQKLSIKKINASIGWIINSTDASLKMCAGKLWPKAQEISKNYPRHKCPAKHKQAQRPKGPTWQLHTREREREREREMQPTSSDTSVIRGNLFSTNQMQVRGSMDPNAAAKPTYQEPIPCAKDQGLHVSTPGRKLEAVGSWARSADPFGRPTA